MALISPLLVRFLASQHKNVPPILSLKQSAGTIKLGLAQSRTGRLQSLNSG
jgi:hypothetical protein